MFFREIFINVFLHFVRSHVGYQADGKLADHLEREKKIESKSCTAKDGIQVLVARDHPKRLILITIKASYQDHRVTTPAQWETR